MGGCYYDDLRSVNEEVRSLTTTAMPGRFRRESQCECNDPQKSQCGTCPFLLGRVEF
jgi:hypothetical protein